jgi:hypothetical protein
MDVGGTVDGLWTATGADESEKGRLDEKSSRLRTENWCLLTHYISQKDWDEEDLHKMYNSFLNFFSFRFVTRSCLGGE